MADRKRKKRSSSNGFFEALNGLLTLVLLALLGIGALFVYGITVFNGEGPSDQERTFVVEPGNVLATVAQRLEEQGFVSNADVFNYGSRLLRRGDNLRAGEFNIAANASMHDIIRELTEGTPIQHQVVIPEGFTSWQVVERVNADPELTGNIDVLPPEGSLLPGAYSYRRGDSRQSVIETMTAAMDAAVAEVWEGRQADLPIETPADLVILASIVERETGLASERPQVAAVFVNRLRVGMRLQSDPTIIYGITLGQSALGRGLRRSEIDQVTPYNTYQIDGLPAGPIANPGIESLRAVAHPDAHDYLYFVAKGAVPSDGHVFAESYAEHLQNVAAYRAIERQAAQDAADAEAQAEMDALAAEEAAEVGDAPSETPAEGEAE
ncbi:endolytic transglycosylase MltG [Pelagibacterium lacus]|uniref:Endolytic murein transglycosylase n=1 Tax=Pelagibacterium lacus TaxID=2282655 RepID=A0A369WCM2_9HYPH|nr:endolytic transglycosylase MltG [Pelagibacterium lacus]RDE09861.1 endolytic transglycosylase MltG [Pelagibacterium lacus]